MVHEGASCLGVLKLIPCQAGRNDLADPGGETIVSQVASAQSQSLAEAMIHAGRPLPVVGTNVARSAEASQRNFLGPSFHGQWGKLAGYGNLSGRNML